MLYREVKGSDRHSDGDVLMTIQSFGEVIYSGRAREIEITEEEIYDIMQATVIEFGGTGKDVNRIATKAILSKLKGE